MYREPLAYSDSTITLKYNLILSNIFILYFIVGYLERQKLLEDQWYFKCGCTRCKDPSDCGTWSNSISCFQCANPRWSPCFLDSWVARATTWLSLLITDNFKENRQSSSKFSHVIHHTTKKSDNLQYNTVGQ